jgi:hypothetical protein
MMRLCPYRNMNAVILDVTLGTLKIFHLVYLTN